jgi:hypothetical protein
MIQPWKRILKRSFASAYEYRTDVPQQNRMVQVGGLQTYFSRTVVNI